MINHISRPGVTRILTEEIVPMLSIPSDRHEPTTGSVTIKKARLPAGLAVLLLVKRKLAFFMAIAAWSMSSAVPGAMAGEEKLSEYQVKAAYLYNFAKFIEWPPRTPGQQNTFTVCVLGKNPFGNALDELNGKQVRNQKMVIRYISSVNEIKGCEMLFISASERENVTTIIAALSSVRGVLTISDTRRFMQAGGMIGFVTVEDRVRFEINNKVAQHANVQISSQLLSLAVMVE